MEKKDTKKILKMFAHYYKPHKKLFILDMFSSLMTALIDLAFPMLSRYTLQNLLPNQMYRTFFILIVTMVVLYIFRSVFEYIRNYWGHILGVRMEHDMRKDLFTHLQKLPFSFYDKNRTGNLMSRVLNDLFEITELAHHGPEDIFLSAVMLIGSFAALLVIEWRLAIALYITVPIILWFAITQRKKLSEGFAEVKKKTAGINSALENSISGIRVSKAFSNENYELEKFQEGNQRFVKSKHQAYRHMGMFSAGMEFLTNILNVIVLGVGGVLIMRGEMDFASLFAFMLYINTFLQPIRRLTGFVQQMESGMAGFKRFIELMEVEPSILDKENAVALGAVKGDISFRNVTFSYDNNENVLNGINLHIEAGKTVALVGPSGGGKTTLCQLIPRFYEINHGEIFVDNHNIQSLKLTSLRENIGIVQQDVFLFAGTIKDNIRYGKIQASDEEIIAAAKKAEIHEFIMTLPDGYNTEVGERGIRLSGGQKQRISIARIFLKNPPILILDEATSALDNETEIKIQLALEKLQEGRTSLVIAHRLSTIKNADEIIVIDEEGIQEQGTHEALLKDEGMYHRLYMSQFRLNEM